uniref:Si:dkey-117m1.4 n=1 Tax=Oryzias latipes TaxID=8090 RepID=A0A3P9LKB7_ORYLA
RGCGRKRKGTPMKVFVTSTEEEPFSPSPNCRIREVHCGTQVRLVVIAIRDIAKGEEITVDYSLTEWGENLYVTPSWSLSPSSSPISHSDASESDAGDEDRCSPRGRPLRRRKKRRGTPSKKRKTHGPGRPTPPSFSGVPQFSPSCSSSSSPTKSAFKPPTALSSGSTSNPSRGVVSTDSVQQTCEYCGRHFHSLGRHLDKHHSHQPDLCSTLVERYTQMPRLHAQDSSTAHARAQQHSKLSHSRSLESAQNGVQDLSMSLSTLSAANQSPASSGRSSMPSVLTPHQGQNAASVLKRSPPLVGRIQSKKGATVGLKTERLVEGEEDEEEIDVVAIRGLNEEDDMKLTCPQSFSSNSAKVGEPPKDEEEEAEEENGLMEVEDESGTEESGRHHMLPLLSSLSSLVLYLRRLQHSAFLSLSRQLQSAEAWRLLCHSSLALLILYNRRRECEVSKLTITEYCARVTPQSHATLPSSGCPALTPLEASLSPFERLVLPHLPRVGVQGKRGRIQPLILPPHCEPCLELLLQTRHDVGVDPANPYIFARPYHSPATPLRGTDLLRSLARSSGTRNPRALTQTRVRRQVAILTQLLLLGEGEEPGQTESSTIERLEHFLEREYHVTQNCAGIGQDPGLMGRVGRVVLCGERDGVLFRGMSLNDICLELDMSGNSADSFSEGESKGEHRKEKLEMPSAAPALKRGVLKRPWSEAERAAVEEHLTQNINELRVPAKADCERCLQKCPLLVNNHRDWRAIKFYCHNRIQLLKKNLRRESQPQPQPLTVC